MRNLAQRIRTRLQAAVGTHEPPSRLAAAWGIGIAVGLSPFLGLHTVLALLLAFFLRLNKLDVLLGTLIMNPWTFPVYFPAAAFLGRWITGIRVPRVVLPHPTQLLRPDVWREQAEWLRPLLVVWGVGATIAAAVGGLATFYLVRAFIVIHRRRRQGGHRHQQDGD